MMVRSGLLTANTAWLAAAPWYVQHDWKGWVAGFGFAMIGSALPDLDHRGSTLGALAGRRTQAVISFLAGGHRMGTHSLPGVYLIWMLCSFLLDSTQGQTVADALAIGVLAHIFTDILTVQGVALLYPCGWPVIWLGRLMGRRGRVLVRLGRLMNAKTRAGWITTNSNHERRYCNGMRVVGATLLLGYALVLAPQAVAWTDQQIDSTISEVQSQ